MFGLFKKYSVSILDQKWEPIRKVIRVQHIPRQGELIYLDDLQAYYRVLNVVHYLNRKQGIFIIVEKLDETPTK